MPFNTKIISLAMISCCTSISLAGCKLSLPGSVQRGVTSVDLEKKLIFDCKTPPSSSNRIANNLVFEGREEFLEGRYNAAIDKFTLAIKADPMFYRAYFDRALSYRKSRKYLLAILDYKKATRVDPKTADADHCLYDNLAIALYFLGDYGPAIVNHDKALQISPRNPIVLANRGVTKEGMRNYVGAIQDYTKALSIDPNSYTAIVNIGNALYKNGQYNLSVNYLNQSIDAHDRSIDYVRRGLSLLKLNKFGDACNDFQMALAKGNSMPTEYVQSYCH